MLILFHGCFVSSRYCILRICVSAQLGAFSVCQVGQVPIKSILCAPIVRRGADGAKVRRKAPPAALRTLGSAHGRAPVVLLLDGAVLSSPRYSRYSRYSRFYWDSRCYWDSWYS